MRKKLVMAGLTAVAAAVTVFVGQQVYSAGYNAGLDEGHAGWYDKGYSEGSEDGYDRGFAAGASSMSTGLSTAELMVSTDEHAESNLEHGEESLEHGAESAEHGEAQPQRAVEHEDEQASQNDEHEYSFVLNKNSKRFHKPNCSSVAKMKEENREYYSGDREALIAKGYKPCGSCNP